MVSPPRDAATNMALDEVMLGTAAATGEVLVRLYQWDTATLSFGRNQRCRDVYSPERCAALTVPAVRRPTGGRALLHAREVTYCVAAPTALAPTLRGGYEAINTLLLDALQRLGVAATRALPAGRTPVPGLAPCFESPSAGELVLDGRKLVGSAQHREQDAFLQHGSILLDDDQGMLGALALVPLPAVPPPATLRASLPTVSFGDVVDAITAALRRAHGAALPIESDAIIPPDHVHSARSRYRDPCWTWRR